MKTNKKSYKNKQNKQNKQNKLSALYQKLTQKEFSFSKNLKQIFFVSLSTFLVAVIMFAFIGFNTSFSLSNTYEFNINFNTEITKEQRDTYSKEIVKELKKNKINNYELTQIGKSYDSAILVSVKNASSKNSENLLLQLEKVSGDIESKLSENYEIDFLKISEIKSFSSSISNKQIMLGVVAIILVMAVVSIYMYFRFDIASTLASLIVNVNNAILLLSLVTILRIPVSTLLFAGLLLTQLLTSYISGVYFAKISEGYDNEKFNNMSNDQVADKMVKSLLKPLLTIFAFTFVVSCALLGISLSLATELAGLLLIGAFLSTFTGIFVTVWIWASLFNKEKDKRFKVRQLKKNAPKKTEEEQIVV